MNKSTLQKTYNGVVISYDENLDQWVFELRDRERRVNTLSDAKTAIDKVPSPAKAKMEPIPAFQRDWSNVTTHGNITSFAADTDYAGRLTEAWFVSANGKRSKERLNNLFLANDSNLALLDQIKLQTIVVDKAKQELRNLVSKLVSVKGPKD